MNKLSLVITIALLLFVSHSTAKAGDTTPPTIGAITAGSCAISIAFTDNEALDLQATTVVVRDGATGGDVTSKFTRVVTGDGTTAGSITFIPKCFSLGTYIVEICAYDKARNQNCQTRAALLTMCSPPSCRSVDPASGLPGQTLDVTILGDNTNFDKTTPVSFSCPSITVNSITVKSLIEIVANISIDDNAELGCNSDIIVSTFDPSCPFQLTCAHAFKIASPFPPECVSVEPSSLQAGEANDVTITLKNIDLTSANGISVSFGCIGITVNSTTVNSATEIMVNIDVAPDAQNCNGDVVITGASDADIVCHSDFTIHPPPCEITVSPSEMRTGWLLGRFQTLAITGSFCEFDNSSTVTIDGGIKVRSFEVDTSNQMTVTIWVPPAILGGKGEKTVTVDGIPATFTVKGPLGR
jgi:hypothetical protein